MARYLHAKGHLFVNTIGYLGPMYAVHHKLNGTDKYEHRSVELKNFVNGKIEEVKSSDLFARTRYWGMFDVPTHLANLKPAYDTCPAF
jgi:hypothetical protein